jgi:hypothetical protein
VTGLQPIDQQNTADLFVLTGSGEYKHQERLPG